MEKPPSKTLPLSIDGCHNGSFNSHIIKPGQPWPIPVGEYQNQWNLNITEIAESLKYDTDNATWNAPRYVVLKLNPPLFS